ncbi:MAG: hypothetical protein KGI61_02895 [Patescibacteria group bacterium]|nr:hypothetical protein [Patescibacteria group bacterium]
MYEIRGEGQMMSLIGTIETEWVRNNKQTFPLPTWFISFITDIDNSVTEYRKINDKNWENILSKIDNDRKKNGDMVRDYQKITGTPQKVIHEHTHHFDNNIQEKDMVLNHRYDGTKPDSFYIIKKGDDFYYNGLPILASKKNTDYYKVFCALYAKLPEGGKVPYKVLIAEIVSRMPEMKNKSDDEMRKFIQRNLTDKNNGFIRYADIPETEDNGHPLISVVRGSGVLFNNKKG